VGRRVSETGKEAAGPGGARRPLPKAGERGSVERQGTRQRAGGAGPDEEQAPAAGASRSSGWFRISRKNLNRPDYRSHIEDTSYGLRFLRGLPPVPAEGPDCATSSSPTRMLQMGALLCLMKASFRRPCQGPVPSKSSTPGVPRLKRPDSISDTRETGTNPSRLSGSAVLLGLRPRGAPVPGLGGEHFFATSGTDTGMRSRTLRLRVTIMLEGLLWNVWVIMHFHTEAFVPACYRTYICRRSGSAPGHPDFLVFGVLVG
jgi:hypothetical protein